MANERTKSIIGPGSFFEGKFYVNGELEVQGKFEGTSLFIDSLTVEKKGKIKTNIKANNVVVEGIVIGNIAARHRVMLMPSAKVLGNIRTPELIIQNGVLLEGKCTIQNDTEKSPAETVEKLYDEKG
jgi:cytoskeletal protein CcmA (bactofilin family)